MKHQFAIATLSSWILPLVAETSESTNVISAASADLLLSAQPATRETKARRLLQRMKQRVERSSNRAKLMNEVSPDVGILSGSTNSRFLQESVSYYCPRDSCPDELCNCADKGGTLEDCTSELQQVCLDGKLSGCVYEGYVAVYEAVYCPFVQCLGGGFLKDKCDCAFYELYCNRLNGEECKSIIPDNTNQTVDKKPFFGCDETELEKVCDQAKSCKESGGLSGLPELSTFKEAATIGITNSVDKISSFSMELVVGMAFLSSIFWVLN